jgi:nitroimidazol reductase NimA-like FMN-containing flavoprotein (pyridoxamine 5'-phosphate oxidase superfamily)
MTVQLTTEQVWQAIEKELFAVIGMATAQSEARTVGVVYVVRGRKLYIGTGKDTWKARHIAANPHISVTIPIARRIPFMQMRYPEKARGRVSVAVASDEWETASQNLPGST